MVPAKKPKTHKGLKKRVKVTAGGKLVHRRGGKSHLLSGKSGKRLRRLRKPTTLGGPMAKKVARQLIG